MKKWIAALGLMAVLVQGAGAWRPAGWVFHNHPWAYDSATGDWHWFNTPDTQWVVNMSNGRWARLPNSALATGWVFYNWPFAYAQSNGAWHWINGADRQWVVNMRTAIWSRFGVSTAPPGMVLIPGGTNEGTNPDSGDYSLTVNPFYMDRHEVTRSLWEEVRAWALANGYTFDNAGLGKAANHPVHSVNWYDAVKWCNARSEKEGLTPVYVYFTFVPTPTEWVYRSGQNDLVVQTAAVGYRLPTAIEWEYAARGGARNRRFPWGDSDLIQHARANYASDAFYPYDTSPTRGSHPAYNDGTQPYTGPVGSFAPNGYGLYDMAGNVWEWCFNWHSDYVDSRREVRGGSYFSFAYTCRVYTPFFSEPDTVTQTRGFRSVRTFSVAP